MTCDVTKVNYNMYLCYLCCMSREIMELDGRGCDAPNPGCPLTTRQPAEYKWALGNPTPTCIQYKWVSGYPTPLHKIRKSLLCTGSSTCIQYSIYMYPSMPQPGFLLIQPQGRAVSSHAPCTWKKKGVPRRGELTLRRRIALSGLLTT